MNKIVNPEIGDLFIQRGVQKVFKENGKITCIDYVNDNLVEWDNFYIDRSFADDIFLLYGHDMNGFKMNAYDAYGCCCFEFKDMSLEEINKRFISLSDFLNDAKFVGREFRRIEPIYRYGNMSVNTGFVRGIRRLMVGPKGVIRDRSYMESYDNSKNIVLYVKNNTFLVKYISRYGDVYKIIHSGYVWDGNYEFFGKVYEEYLDRDMVYSEIVEQINSYNKKCVKTRIRVK